MTLWIDLDEDELDARGIQHEALTLGDPRSESRAWDGPRPEGEPFDFDLGFDGGFAAEVTERELLASPLSYAFLEHRWRDFEVVGFHRYAVRWLRREVRSHVEESREAAMEFASHPALGAAAYDDAMGDCAFDAAHRRPFSGLRYWSLAPLPERAVIGRQRGYGNIGVVEVRNDLRLHLDLAELPRLEDDLVALRMHQRQGPVCRGLRLACREAVREQRCHLISWRLRPRVALDDRQLVRSVGLKLTCQLRPFVHKDLVFPISLRIRYDRGDGETQVNLTILALQF